MGLKNEDPILFVSTYNSHFPVSGLMREQCRKSVYKVQKGANSFLAQFGDISCLTTQNEDWEKFSYLDG